MLTDSEEQEKETMMMLERSISMLNSYGIVGPHRKVMKFNIIDCPD